MQQLTHNRWMWAALAHWKSTGVKFVVTISITILEELWTSFSFLPFLPKLGWGLWPLQTSFQNTKVVEFIPTILMQSWKKFEGLLSSPSFQPSLQEWTVVRSEFSDKQIKLFETRYSEGYDIFEDEEYILWLKSYHPEAIPSNLDSKVANDDDDDDDESKLSSGNKILNSLTSMNKMRLCNMTTSVVCTSLTCHLVIPLWMKFLAWIIVLPTSSRTIH